MATTRSTKATNANTDIIDINISGIRKKRFRINGDDTKILELNTSDLNIAQRLTEAYPQLVQCEADVANLQSEKPDESNTFNLDDMQKFTTQLKSVDDRMRELIDYIFDSNVSEICADSGSMYDPVDGYPRYEIIINSLSGLYTDNLSREMKKVQTRMKKHTDKYTKKK